MWHNPLVQFCTRFALLLSIAIGAVDAINADPNPLTLKNAYGMVRLSITSSIFSVGRIFAECLQHQ
jgi:hypothetical protein